MSRGIKGLAKIDVRDEVELCMKGLRSKDVAEVTASACQLERGLADVVGTALLPFANAIGGELAACVKRHGAAVPEGVWDAAASLSLAIGAVGSKSLCEPLIEQLLHNAATRTPAALAAAQTFIAVSVKFLPASIRNGVDCVCVKYLYDALVFRTIPLDVGAVEAYLELLCASVTAPAVFGFNPVTSHALCALRHAAATPKLGPQLRTTARWVLNALDAQAHCPSAPVAVPTLEEVYAHAKQLEGVSASDLAFFEGPGVGEASGGFGAVANTTGAPEAQSTWGAPPLTLAPPQAVAPAPAVQVIDAPPVLSVPPVVAPMSPPPAPAAAAVAPVTPTPEIEAASQLSDGDMSFGTPNSILASPVPNNDLIASFIQPQPSRKRSRSPDAAAAEPAAKKPTTTLVPPTMFASQTGTATLPSAQGIPDSQPSTEPNDTQRAGSDDDDDDDEESSEGESLDVPDVDLGGL